MHGTEHMYTCQRKARRWGGRSGVSRSKLRDIQGIGRSVRHVLHELSMLADTTLHVRVSFSEIRKSLPWLQHGGWEWAIRTLTERGILVRVQVANQHRPSIWRINIPQDRALNTGAPDSSARVLDTGAKASAPALS